MAHRISDEDPAFVVPVVTRSGRAKLDESLLCMVEILHRKIHADGRLDVTLPGRRHVAVNAFEPEPHVMWTGQVHGVIAAVDDLPARHRLVELRKWPRIGAGQGDRGDLSGSFHVCASRLLLGFALGPEFRGDPAVGPGRPYAASDEAVLKKYDL
jgi:hypothetical protein